MLTSRSIFNESAYPGEYTPQHQILEALSQGLFEGNRSPVEPKVSVAESDSTFKVEFTAPGIKRENLLVTINDKGNLSIISMMRKRKGVMDVKAKKASIETLLKEVPLPEYVDSSFTSATCHAGTLTIYFKKADHPVHKRPSTIVVY